MVDFEALSTKNDVADNSLSSRGSYGKKRAGGPPATEQQKTDKMIQVVNERIRRREDKEQEIKRDKRFMKKKQLIDVD